MYNNYIEPRGLIHDADFLTHDFMPTMLDALGLQDTSGVIFEVVEHDYFNITDLGMWDQMMPGMINVSSFRRGICGFFFLSFIRSQVVIKKSSYDNLFCSKK